MASKIIDTFSHANLDEIICKVEDVIINFPRMINEYRDVYQLYDAYAAVALLHEKSHLDYQLELIETLILNQTLFSKELQRSVEETLLSMAAQAESTSMYGIFHAGIYVFAIAVSSDKFYAFETHPIPEKSFGNGNGLIVVTDSPIRLMEWITLRLQNSGVRNDCIPSFLTVFERNIPDQNEEGYIDLSMDDPNREDEDYSLNVDTDPEKVEFYRNDICLPVFIKGENKATGTESIASLIINENIPFDNNISSIRTRRKQCLIYHQFVNMIRFKPQLKNIFAVGTDDDLNLYTPLLDCFQAAIHLLCTIHIVDAIKRECDDLGINPDFCIQEIIGIKSGSIKIKGTC